MLFFFFFKQKTAYEMRISDWSSDVCSSDLRAPTHPYTQALLRAVALDHLGQRLQAGEGALHGLAANAAADGFLLHAGQPGIEVLLRHLYGSAALCRGIAALSCALCAGCQGQQQAAEQKCCGTPQDAVKKPHAPFSQTCRADSIAGTCATRPLTLAICRPARRPARESAAGGEGLRGDVLWGLPNAGAAVSGRRSPRR